MRLLQAGFVLIGITAVCFIVLHLTGDPAALLLPENATEEDYDNIRKTMGFDRPLYIQFFDYMKNAFSMDFGHSFQQNQPAFKIVMERLPATIELAIVAFVIALLIAIPVGMISWENLQLSDTVILLRSSLFSGGRCGLIPARNGICMMSMKFSLVNTFVKSLDII